MSTALKPSPDDMTPAEVDQLANDEAIIEAGITVFYKVGMALCRIRDQRTYRATHDTFEAYVAERWSMSRTRAYQLIESGVVTEQMSTIVDTPPIENEGQARAIAPIVKEHGPEVAAEVLTEVAQDGPITAKAIKTKVKAKVAVESPSDDDMAAAAAEVKRRHEQEVLGYTAEQVRELPLTEVIALDNHITNTSAPMSEADKKRFIDRHGEVVDVVDDRTYVTRALNQIVPLLTIMDVGDGSEVREMFAAGLGPDLGDLRAAATVLSDMFPYATEDGAA